MFRKRVITVLLLIAVLILTIPPTAVIAKENEINLESGAKIELPKNGVVVARDEMIINPETSKRVSTIFETSFALCYGVIHGEITVNFYNDSKEVIFDGSYGVLPKTVRLMYENWALSDKYTSWLAKKDGIEHIATNIERNWREPKNICWTYGCYLSYYKITYFHYESKNSQEPICAYQKRVSYCESCGSFSTDYLNEVDLDDCNTDNNIDDSSAVKELKNYTEAEMYEYLHNHFENTMSNNALSEYMKAWAKNQLAELDNNRLLYAVDNENHLNTHPLIMTGSMRKADMINWIKNILAGKSESRGKTVVNSNFESLMKRYAK
jgi:hypothetical protein